MHAMGVVLWLAAVLSGVGCVAVAGVWPMRRMTRAVWFILWLTYAGSLGGICWISWHAVV